MWICGVRVPHDLGALAHSDGDVGLHALCDALLGSLGLGDIGVLFPDNDAQWKDRASGYFVRECVRRVRAVGYEVGNVDLVVMLERPKLRPHVEAMRAQVAAELGVDVECVSIKATTMERTGASGAGDAVACHAVVLVERIGRELC